MALDRSTDEKKLVDKGFILDNSREPVEDRVKDENDPSALDPGFAMDVGALIPDLGKHDPPPTPPSVTTTPAPGPALKPGHFWGTRFNPATGKYDRVQLRQADFAWKFDPATGKYRRVPKAKASSAKPAGRWKSWKTTAGSKSASGGGSAAKKRYTYGKPYSQMTAAERWAAAAIEQQLGPMVSERDQAKDQFRDQFKTSQTAMRAQRSEYDNLAVDAEGRTGQQLVDVAMREGANDQAFRENLSFLRDVFGVGGQAGVAEGSVDTGGDLLAQASAGNAGAAAQLAAQNQAQQRDLDMYGATAQARHLDYTMRAKAARDRALKDIQRQITLARRQFPLLARQYTNDDREYNLKVRALDQTDARLAQEQAQFDASFAEGQRQFDADAAAASAAADAENAASSPANTTRELVTGLNGAIASVQSNFSQGLPFEQAVEPLRALGLRNGVDYVKEGNAAKLTLDGAVYFFGRLSKMPANQVYYATKLYSPGLANNLVLRWESGKPKLYRKTAMRNGSTEADRVPGNGLTAIM